MRQDIEKLANASTSSGSGRNSVGDSRGDDWSNSGSDGGSDGRSDSGSGGGIRLPNELKSDPLLLHGRHFGRTVFALCNYPSLLTNGILQLEQLEEASIEDFPAEERREHFVFEKLLDSYPGLLERLREGSEEEVLHVGELIGKGASAARGEDTKSLKPVVIDWIVPVGELQSGEIAVSGDQWPRFLYTNEAYDPDDPWNGLLINAYRHVFTSPSSVEREPKATRAGNSRLHGMTSVTAPSVAYIAMQVQFALSSSSVFSCTDTVTDSETFYHSILDLFEDPDERGEVTDFLVWWNRQIFPTSTAAKRTLKANSALSKICQKRAALKDSNDSTS
ncbi:uncharacterized protein F5147DRAFT_749012 [Suillus discolor]|uniref:Uncharacterized protein n=1 Tax=Suillus discolor TaxID=1912936 RepID=A0A9P7EQ63_9AGAM|nr:uncharacterized protein F5147DRAFT_749012 [Suillus discolor]KAG2082518.1 hypothetical protein F5147DRAFT_749012 [Suillus discolor]